MCYQQTALRRRGRPGWWALRVRRRRIQRKARWSATALGNAMKRAKGDEFAWSPHGLKASGFSLKLLQSPPSPLYPFYVEFKTREEVGARVGSTCAASLSADVTP